jgi:predicted DNA-binding transcriptional regulator AlpA
MPPRSIASSPLNKDLLSSHEVADRFSIAHRTLWKMVARGQFPQPIRFNSRLVRLKTRDLQAYLDSMPTKATPGM